ncbi:MAG: response regulator, partial [Selenomonas sp.]|nr:response regulator [Selenomonas sp.]
MSETKEKKVVIVMCNYSVVVKGIERKLKEIGCKVFIITQEKDNLPKFDKEKETALFIFYLPNNIMEDVIKFNWLEHVYGKIHDLECECEVIVIGDKSERDDLTGRVFGMLHVGWLDRPVKMEELELAVTEGIFPEVEGNTKKHILIVDDDPSYAKMVREWIKDSYQVSIVTAGIQAITFLAKKSVDMILLDYEMPVVSGLEVFRILRSEETTVNIPVIFITSKDDKDIVMKVLEVHPLNYLLKPIA